MTGIESMKTYRDRIKKNCTGQIDIIGLMIVVILIIIGGLFYIKYGVLGEKDAVKDTTQDQLLAVNMLNAMLNVNTCGGKERLADAFVSCFDSEKFCEEEACNYAKRQIEEIASSAGLEEYKSYSIWIEKEGKTKYLTDECKTGVKVDELIKNEDRGEYTVNLRIC